MGTFLAILPAVFSALASIAAAIAAWRMPKLAAQFAHQLSQDSQNQKERAQRQYEIFATLMQERAALYSQAGTRALNSIDVVFSDAREVRAAWAELFWSYDTANHIPPHGQNERQEKLLKEIAKAIGSGDLQPNDFKRVYFPVALQQESMIKDLERKQAIARLQQQEATPNANTAPPQLTKWPPAPS